MKVLFDLPEKEQDAVDKELCGESILYCTPFDLKISGSMTSGWFVITKDSFLVVDEGEIKRKEIISDYENYVMVNGVGSGTLEAESSKGDKIILRFSMAHVPRYTFIASILSTLSKGEIPKVISDDKENKCPKCGRVYAKGSKVCHHCMNKKVVAKRFWSLIKPYKILMLFTIILFWISTVLSLIDPAIYRKLIDDYLSKQKVDALGIFLLVLAIGVCDALGTAVSIIRNRCMIKVGNGISRDLSKSLFEKIQSLSIEYMDSRKIGDIMNRITGDSNTVQQFISNQASQGINQLLTLLAVSIILLVMNWKLALLVMLPVPFVARMWGWMRKTFGTMYHTQWKIWDRCNSTLHDILSGIRVVKAFGMEKKEVGRFTKVSEQLKVISSRNEKIFNTIGPMLNFFMGIGNYLILYFGGKFILGQQMKIGELIQFTQYTAMIYGPLGWLTTFPRALTQSATATERIFEILDEEPKIKDEANSLSHNIKGKVTFDNITFGYRSYEPVVKNINLDVKPGEMIGLVGHSGAGKSTLINLIMRLYDVDEGRLLIDGKDIRDISLEDLRYQVGVVLQEPFLFSGTILQNITFAKPDATLEEVIRAAKIANAHDFIMNFPDGYDTRVGERGQRLSGGEKQRISIARAVLHDPKILILDEATASVDTETEYKIQEALGKLVKNRTTFAIAHRLSTLRNANRLIVLDKGKQIELGTHDELIKAKGKYYSLVMAQREMTKIKKAQ